MRFHSFRFRISSIICLENYLSIGEDGGESFSKSLRRIYEDYRQGGIPALLRGRLEGGSISDLAIDPHDGSIYVAVKEGVMKSADGGMHWEKINFLQSNSPQFQSLKA